ncbi:polyprenol phosphomannose-dependent alpha 1,6 mannosyltransferase MptB [Peterkaempfera sp. SMS 1(5)a]|uniref:polyprenol phosphomannose-dependent alpha 1,6 mannosyltransferase MptB n=1 Tax=Peterkaempfera podocarpi TaxID=3232308 RepID=UPI00366EED85
MSVRLPTPADTAAGTQTPPGERRTRVSTSTRRRTGGGGGPSRTPPGIAPSRRPAPSVPAPPPRWATTSRRSSATSSRECQGVPRCAHGRSTGRRPRVTRHRHAARVTEGAACRWLGFAGATALALGGLGGAGALPVQDILTHPSLGVFAAYFGLVLLIAAWWWLGRIIRSSPTPTRCRDLVLVLALWAAPLLLAPPLFSRDVYSYLAQGAMVRAHIDIYAYGPDQLGGPLAAQVPPIWRDTPAPYGPVFLALAAALEPAGVAGMRLAALGGVALMAALLPRLARRCGADPAAALWLGGLNPLVLLHLVAGAHNDAVMLGLLGAGLLAALAGAPVRATVLVTLAALVKAPAAPALVAVALLWQTQLGGDRHAAARAWAAVAGLAATVTAAVTAATGTGYGWLSALSTPVTPLSWSLTAALGHAFGDVPLWRAAGLTATAATALILWRRRTRLGPIYALGLTLTALALLGPAIRPWYILWGCFLIAAAAPHTSRIRRHTATLSALMALAVLPSGFAPHGNQVALAVGGGALAALTLLCLRAVRTPT